MEQVHGVDVSWMTQAAPKGTSPRLPRLSLHQLPTVPCRFKCLFFYQTKPTRNLHHRLPRHQHLRSRTKRTPSRHRRNPSHPRKAIRKPTAMAPRRPRRTDRLLLCPGDAHDQARQTNMAPTVLRRGGATHGSPISRRNSAPAITPRPASIRQTNSKIHYQSRRKTIRYRHHRQ